VSSLLLPSLTEFASTTDPIPLSRSRHIVLHRDAGETTCDEASGRSLEKRMAVAATEVMVNGPDDVYLERGGRIERAPDGRIVLLNAEGLNS
jgi:hypothetical protein